MTYRPELPRHTVAPVEAPGGYSTAYAVSRPNVGVVGYVASRKESGHSTLWAHAEHLEDLRGAWSPSRPLALEGLFEFLADREADDAKVDAQERSYLL
jgi:hypothetical protein